MTEEPTPPGVSIAAIILAAGASRRLGRAKQLLLYQGETLVGRAARLALAVGCDPVMVVVGGEAAAIEAALAELPVRIVPNPTWEEGMGSSVRAGIAALPTETDAVLFLLTDQPKISQDLLTMLLGKFRANRPPLVVSDYGEDRLGVPAVFDRSLFPDLRRLEGDRGARGLIRARATLAERVAFPEGRLDIDTEADWRRLFDEEP